VQDHVHRANDERHRLLFLAQKGVEIGVQSGPTLGERLARKMDPP
jgi:hypothetical protein